MVHFETFLGILLIYDLKFLELLGFFDTITQSILFLGSSPYNEFPSLQYSNIRHRYMIVANIILFQKNQIELINVFHNEIFVISVVISPIYFLNLDISVLCIQYLSQDVVTELR